MFCIQCVVSQSLYQDRTQENEKVDIGFKILLYIVLVAVISGRAPCEMLAKSARFFLHCKLWMAQRTVQDTLSPFLGLRRKRLRRIFQGWAVRYRA